MAIPAGLLNRAPVPVPSCIPATPAEPARRLTTPLEVILTMA